MRSQLVLVWFSGFLKGCPAHSVVDFNRASDIHILGYLLVDIVGTQAAVDSKVKVRIVDVYVSCSSIVFKTYSTPYRRVKDCYRDRSWKQRQVIFLVNVWMAWKVEGKIANEKLRRRRSVSFVK